MSPNQPFSLRLTLLLLAILDLLPRPVSPQGFSDPAEFVQTAVSRHPSLQKSRELVHSAEFGLKASGLQPNSTLDLAATSEDASENSNALSQSFEIAWSPSVRQILANALLGSEEKESANPLKKIALAWFVGLGEGERMVVEG